MKISELKNAAKQGIVIRLTFDGAFQRAKIYNKNANAKQRKDFRIYMAKLLREYLIKIQGRKRYSDSDHYKTIEAFAAEVSGKYKGILKKNKFRIGSAQKFINLYWKICWLLQNDVSKPIHCPFDSIIMKKLPQKVRVPWTAFDTIKEYETLVNAVKNKIADNESIAEWELEEYLKK